jgi:hypothetical protein
MVTKTAHLRPSGMTRILRTYRKSLQLAQPTAASVSACPAFSFSGRVPTDVERVEWLFGQGLLLLALAWLLCARPEGFAP